MLGFVIQRLLQAVIVMIAMSILVFVGVYAIGNPIDVLLSPDADQRIRAETIARYGLDRPLWEQYLAFAGRLLRGDFGRSFIFGIPVLDLVMSRLPATGTKIAACARESRVRRRFTRDSGRCSVRGFRRGARSHLIAGRTRSRSPRGRGHGTSQGAG